MYSKKGITIPLFGTFMVIASIITFWAVGYLVNPTFERTTIQTSGDAMSLSNNADIWQKIFDESIDIIARRAAYDFGKIGGLKGSEVATWSASYPNISVLSDQFSTKLEESFPKNTIGSEKTVQWLGSHVNISYNQPQCIPLLDSTCFLVNGTSNFSVYYKSIDSEINMKLNLNRFVNSSYYKLLSVGRKIFEDAAYYNLLVSDRPQLELNILNDHDVTAIITASGDYVDVTLIDHCFYPYCIAPLKPDELKIINVTPYDFLTLNFRIYSPGLGGFIHVWAYSGAVEVPAVVTVVDEGFRKKGDVNRDGVVNIFDTIIISSNYGQTVPPASPDLDLRQDGRIDIFDITIVNSHYGLKAPQYTTYFNTTVEAGNVTLYAKYNGLTLSQSRIINVGATENFIFNFP